MVILVFPAKANKSLKVPRNVPERDVIKNGVMLQAYILTVEIPVL